jgi:hypothetical protein
MKRNEHSIYYESLDLVRTEEKNPKDHDIEEIIRSINRFGFVQPLLINETTGKLIAGHGRLEAIKEIQSRGLPIPSGISEKKGKWFVPTIRNVSFEDDQEANAYIIADNRLVELGGWDSDKLDSMLIDLKSSGERSMEGIGFTELDITKLKNNKVDPEIEFTTEILESNQYVVFVFNNIMDWNMIKENLNITTKDTTDSREGSKYRTRGLGRVLDGSQLINLVNKKNDS